jgi:hypothetical protein
MINDMRGIVMVWLLEAALWIAPDDADGRRIVMGLCVLLRDRVRISK